MLLATLMHFLDENNISIIVLEMIVTIAFWQTKLQDAKDKHNGAGLARHSSLAHLAQCLAL